MDVSILGEYGIDHEKGISRCMGDAEFYERMLGLFLQDGSFNAAKAAYESGDDKALFSAAHELKGASGNTALTELYSAASALVELLRAGDAERPMVETLFTAMEAAYARAREGVCRALDKI